MPIPDVIQMPVCIDLFCGLGGWAEAFLAEGYRVKGYDIEKHDYGFGTYPGELFIRDVRSLHGSQFADANIIVASPPCQEPSYRAMPWKKAKALNAIGPPHNFIELFNTCFRIQREASEAAGRYVPLIVENVRGAQVWVGRARWHYGSYYLWGDVPALMPITFSGFKSSGMNWSDRSKHGQDFTRIAGKQAIEGIKVGMASERRWEDRPIKQLHDAVKSEGGWFGGKYNPLQHGINTGSGSKARKRAAAEIAKIPFPLAWHIARCFK